MKRKAGQRARLREQELLLGQVSHEVRNALNGILGLCEIGLKSDEETEKERERVEEGEDGGEGREEENNGESGEEERGGNRKTQCLLRIETCARFLREQLERMLEYSRAGAGAVRRDIFSLAQFLEAMETLYGTQAKAKGILLEIRCAEELRLSLVGDWSFLCQIVGNLLGNAIKFTPGGGTIRLSVTECPGSGKAGGLWLRFAVRDTGCGISKKEAGKIFRPYEQGCRGTAVRSGGTGLGLALVQKLTAQLGGRLTVKSAPGKGSVFAVKLPFERASESHPTALKVSESHPTALEAPESHPPTLETPESPPPAVPKPGAGQSARRAGPCACAFSIARKEIQSESDNSSCRIHFRPRHFLLAEDNQLNCEIAAEFFRGEFGAEVTAVRDGGAAVASFRQSPPDYFDLILLDQQMPVLNGCQAAARIRRLRRVDAATIPILAMSGERLSEESCRAAGMNGQLGKPLNKEEIREKLPAALNFVRPAASAAQILPP